jgi:hypothetical protein
MVPNLGWRDEMSSGARLCCTEGQRFCGAYVYGRPTDAEATVLPHAQETPIDRAKDIGGKAKDRCTMSELAYKLPLLNVMDRRDGAKTRREQMQQILAPEATVRGIFWVK